MVLALLSRVGRVRVTVAYAVALIGVSTALSALDPAAQDRVIRHASTNLHNLSHGHIGTLFNSAFVIDGGPVYEWLPGLALLLALAELLWRSGRLLVAFVIGHVGATLLVAVGLTSAVEAGWVSVASVSRATDVGMSYGATAVLGSLTAAIPVRWRPMWIGWWLAVGVAVLAIGRDFTDTGHVVALILGMVVATRFGRPAGWTPGRVVLLFVAAAFGYLLLASGGLSLVVGVVVGAVGAFLGAAGSHARLHARDKSASSDSHHGSLEKLAWHQSAATIVGRTNKA